MSNKMYSIAREKDTYLIRENKTSHIIRTDLTKEIAKNMMKSWQGGRGFLGWTPSFMCTGKGELKVNDQPEKA